ncbi:DNA mismatch repair protein MutT [Candidatus Uhrbacteria bacterium CG10_big_fil_rev_8_21_14_0_10_48_11]|uniref:DNA mismatch repair protein MutT n=1 Tax=Candidatus Uhrbacteria bacterium CG10_big_fil_rev_8_21_14_0_10_48_11 TaxID=1975037 RepID=A0A2M8LET7_9BACT|nr:MAG: DNA mismatch repair protein MutT [Candidatus Uhrbacteria bacterium CG10_big_fil_rev_8_21_14_0_10_48_11]
MLNLSQPLVGVVVMVFKEGKVLLHKRKGSHGNNEYGSLGGHLEHGESFEECARRECREEAGIEIQNVRFLFLMNVKRYAPKHYVHINLVADWKSGEPKNMEPDKGGEWQWYDLEKLPSPLFYTEPFVFESLKTGQNY